ncbi:hypothetical protein Q4543_15985 [Salipiger sp. 1_MG-2023]|uniref:hypothetical protein n=1 Tax=Salipiger sp. 1_MG-2023 TaxID=3062665 RepID=UPI0026E36FAC|nr:hypothetical protein [Salipiger sp. 1_MG-2023]MDO6587014.1 hypothetical protein [Salipiger sp. 1_MG-2023]
MSGQADKAPGRANLGFAGGFDDELDRFDPAEWSAPRQPRPKPAPETQAASRQLAEATGFRSREPGAGEGDSRRKAAPKPDTDPTTESKPAPRPQRRRRTGRNAQFNIKARPETIEAFCAVADAHGWGLGETLEHAVTLLAADLEARGKRRG